MPDIEPISREEQYLAAVAGESGTTPDSPVTRREVYLAKAAGVYDGEIPEPVTREETYLKQIAENGGGSAVLIEKSVTDNGTYTASDDSADGYSKVVVDVEPDLITKSITANGTYTALEDEAGGYSAVTVNVPTAPVYAPMKDVNFYDYDGTIVYSYTQAEFANLEAMPDNPSHDGLTAQGWNWSLSDAKTYVAAYKKLDIGQMYITSDSKTRLYITLSEGRTSPWLKLYLDANSELDIDWGDGSTHSTFTSTSADFKNEQHVYASAGDYVIAITVVSGSFVLQSSSSSLSTVLTNNNNSAISPDIAYLNSIKHIEIGSGVTSIGSNAFNGCYSLSSITIPDSITSIGSNAFYNCSSLSSITIPDGVTSIGSNAFNSCYSIATITINKPEGSISGSPWGANTGAPTSTQIVWTG